MATKNTPATPGQKAAATKAMNKAASLDKAPAKVAAKKAEVEQAKAAVKAAKVEAKKPKVVKPVAAKPAKVVEPKIEQNDVSLQVMNRKDLVPAVRKYVLGQGFGMSDKVALAAIDGVIASVQVAVESGTTVMLPGLGQFKLSLRKARKGRNPKTGEPMDIAATIVPSFKIAKALKDSANRNPDVIAAAEKVTSEKPASYVGTVTEPTADADDGADDTSGQAE